MVKAAFQRKAQLTIGDGKLRDVIQLANRRAYELALLSVLVPAPDTSNHSRPRGCATH